MSLAVDVALAFRRDEGEGVIEVMAFAFDETRGDPDLPLPAALPQVCERRPVAVFGEWREVGAMAVSGVEEFGKDDKVRAARRAWRSRSSARVRLAETSWKSDDIWMAATAILKGATSIPAWSSASGARR